MKNKCLRFISKLSDIGAICVGIIILLISTVLFFGSITGTADLALDEMIMFKTDNIFLNILQICFFLNFDPRKKIKSKGRRLLPLLLLSDLFSAKFRPVIPNRAWVQGQCSDPLQAATYP